MVEEFIHPKNGFTLINWLTVKNAAFIQLFFVVQIDRRVLVLFTALVLEDLAFLVML